MNVLANSKIQKTPQGANASLVDALSKNLSKDSNLELVAQEENQVEGKVNEDFASLLTNENEEQLTENLTDETNVTSEDKNVNPENAKILNLQNVGKEASKKPLVAKEELLKGQADTELLLNTKKSPIPVNQVKKPYSEEEIVKNLKSIFVKPTSPQTMAEELMPKGKNAEDASRAFMPERKSIFVKKEEAVVEKQAMPNEKGNLVDLQSFINKQSPALKNQMAKQAYVMENNQSMFNKAAETKPLLKADTAAKKTNILEMSLNQDIASANRGLDLAQMMKDSHGQSDLNSSHGTKDVFDVKNLKSSDSEVIIDQIKDYVIQSKVSNQPKVEMTFHHNDLGSVNLMVEKSKGDDLNITIASASSEGMKFFTQHKTDLMNSLSHAGVNVSDIKLESSNKSQDFAQNFNQRNNQGQSENQGQSNQRNEDSRRREEIWNKFKEREAA